MSSVPKPCARLTRHPSERNSLLLSTRTPYTVDYASEGGGKAAHNMLRWVAATSGKGSVERVSRCGNPHYGYDNATGMTIPVRNRSEATLRQ